jgi:predicted alpha/beta superfamily hydrolase
MPTQIKTTLLCIALISIIIACKENTGPKADITIGRIDSLHSEVLGEDRKVWIHVPDNYNTTDSTKRYPVLYLLDGDAHFYSVVGLIHQLSSVNGNDVCPRMIVVAIPNTNRTRDLTPTHVESKKESENDFFKPSGGGEKFTDFIEQELIPYVDKNYPSTKDRLLVGHSLGGLMVINTLVKRPHMFNKYIAIDPSLWWDEQKSLKEYEQALQDKTFDGKSLFIGVANTISMDTLRALSDTSDNTQHFRSILHFVKQLKRIKTHGVNWSYKYYGDEGHGSVPMISEYDALHFLFRKKPIAMDQTQLRVFEGRYQFQFEKGKDSFLEITATPTQLLLKELWTGREMRFDPLSETEFYSFDSHFPLKFIKDNNGVVKQVLALNSDLWNKVSK